MQRPDGHRVLVHGLALRGGKKGPHADGWGLALYEGHAARTFLEPAAAADSPLAKYVRENPIKTLLAIAHVRKRTRGAVSLANTHPFVRELWGRHFVFAHNGTVKNVRRHATGRFRPIGETDSEHALCALLHRLDEAFPSYPASSQDLWEAVAAFGGDRKERDVQLPPRRRLAPVRAGGDQAPPPHSSGAFQGGGLDR